MTAVWISLVAVLAIAWAIEFSIRGIRRRRHGHAAGWAELLKSLALTSVITIGATVAVSVVLAWTGLVDAQFFRPSARDYGQRERLGLAPEDVVFTSADGTRLSGWLLRATGEPLGTVIHFHGSDRNVTGTVGNAAWLTDRGFNVFAFDYRGYGRSDGDPSRQGVVEDGVAAIDYVRSRADTGRGPLWLWGQSMGGQLAIVAAREAGTTGIQGVVAEATYASHAHHAKDKVGNMGPLWLVQWAVWLVTSERWAAERVVGDLAPVPLLVVHGTADAGVLPYHGDRLYDAAGDPKDIWRIDGAGHLEVFSDPSARSRLVEFFQRTAPPALEPAPVAGEPPGS